MDGKSNAIRGRISSVKNTKKITEAMRLVAAAKVRVLGLSTTCCAPACGKTQV